MYEEYDTGYGVVDRLPKHWVKFFAESVLCISHDALMSCVSVNMG